MKIVISGSTFFGAIGAGLLSSGIWSLVMQVFPYTKTGISVLMIVLGTFVLCATIAYDSDTAK